MFLLKLPVSFLILKGSQKKIIELPPSNHVLNPLENLWSVMKMEIYEGAKQYENKTDLWETVKTGMLKTDLLK